MAGSTGGRIYSAYSVIHFVYQIQKKIQLLNEEAAEICPLPVQGILDREKSWGYNETSLAGITETNLAEGI